MKTITRVIRSGAIKGGQGVQLDLVFDGDTEESLQCHFHTVPTVVRALMQAANGAAKLQAGLPPQDAQLVDPYRATNCKAGETSDGRVVIEFSTKESVPVQIAMTPSVAQKAIERLTEVLNTLGNTPPSAKH